MVAEIVKLAERLLANAEKLSEEPFSGWDKTYSQLGEAFAREAVAVFHDFLVVCDVGLSFNYDRDWSALREATSSWEAWQEYGA